MAEQQSIFPEVRILRTPRVVTVLCECIGTVASKLSNLPSEPLASHGDYLPSWLPDATRDEANKVIN